MSLTSVDHEKLSLVGPYADQARHVWELAAMSVPFEEHDPEVFWFVIFFKPEIGGFCANAFDWTADDYEDEIKQIMARLMTGCVAVGVISYKDTEDELVDSHPLTLPEADKHHLSEQDIFEAYKGIFTQLAEEYESEN